ncbi:MAG: helix-hairpin-helix domain-containing protein [Actinomycetota bacterium]
MPVVTDPAPTGDPILQRPAPPRGWRERVEHVADATGTTPARILVGGAAAIGVGLIALWMTRPSTTPPEVNLPFASTTVALAPISTDAQTTEEVVVHVAGAVRTPGVYELPSGSRVVDAIEAAGGLSGDADGSRINLASPVTDGERIYVPRVGEAEPPVVVGDGGHTGSTNREGPLDLNEADEAALDALPGIGPTTASAIVEHRSRIGRFTSVDQLLDVRGIGEAKLEQLRPLVTV